MPKTPSLLYTRVRTNYLEGVQIATICIEFQILSMEFNYSKTNGYWNNCNVSTMKLEFMGKAKYGVTSFAVSLNPCPKVKPWFRRNSLRTAAPMKFLPLFGI